MLRPRTGTSCEAKELRLLWDAHYLDAWNGYCRQHSLVSECSSYHIPPRIVTVVSEANLAPWVGCPNDNIGGRKGKGTA